MTYRTMRLMLYIMHGVLLGPRCFTLYDVFYLVHNPQPGHSVRIITNSIATLKNSLQQYCIFVKLICI